MYKPDLSYQNGVPRSGNQNKDSNAFKKEHFVSCQLISTLLQVEHSMPAIQQFELWHHSILVQRLTSFQSHQLKIVQSDMCRQTCAPILIWWVTNNHFVLPKIHFSHFIGVGWVAFGGVIRGMSNPDNICSQYNVPKNKSFLIYLNLQSQLSFWSDFALNTSLLNTVVDVSNLKFAIVYFILTFTSEIIIFPSTPALFRVVYCNTFSWLPSKITIPCNRVPYYTVTALVCTQK